MGLQTIPVGHIDGVRLDIIQSSAAVEAGGYRAGGSVQARDLGRKVRHSTLARHVRLPVESDLLFVVTRHLAPIEHQGLPHPGSADGPKMEKPHGDVAELGNLVR